LNELLGGKPDELAISLNFWDSLAQAHF
jgi:hypothetical protein